MPRLAINNPSPCTTLTLQTRERLCTTGTENRMMMVVMQGDFLFPVAYDTIRYFAVLTRSLIWKPIKSVFLIPSPFFSFPFSFSFSCAFFSCSARYLLFSALDWLILGMSTGEKVCMWWLSARRASTVVYELCKFTFLTEWRKPLWDRLIIVPGADAGEQKP